MFILLIPAGIDIRLLIMGIHLPKKTIHIRSVKKTAGKKDPITGCY